MIDFISNNSIWFIIGAVLIVLVIIGYFVDKKGFGVKTQTVEPVKKNDKPKEEPKKASKNEDVDMDIPFVPEKDTENEETKEEEIKTVELTSDLDEYATKPVEENETKAGTETIEELSVPFGDQESTKTPVEEFNESIEKITKEDKKAKKEEKEDIWNF